jgi:hypothetical protein
MTKRAKSRKRSASGPNSKDPHHGPKVNHIFGSSQAGGLSVGAGASSDRDRIGDVEADPGRHLADRPSRDRGSEKIESSGIPSTARAIRAEVEAEQNALHAAVDGLLTEAREQGHLAALISRLLARVSR